MPLIVQPEKDQASDTGAFLRAEYQHLANSFWRNEEAGEKRVTFFITLVTAVIAALVTLAKSENGLLYKICGENGIYGIAGYALLALLLFGITTLRRMIKRNQVTDEYKRVMDMIRSRFRNWDSWLQDYQPFDKGQLATLELTDKRYLDKGAQISGILTRKFAMQGIVLSYESSIKKESGGWLITDEDNKQNYMVWEEGQKLKVYHGGKMRQLGTGGLAEIVIVMNSLIVVALIALSIAWLDSLNCMRAWFSAIDCIKVWLALDNRIMIIVIYLLLPPLSGFLAGVIQWIYTGKRYA